MLPSNIPLHVTPSPGQDREEPEQAHEDDIPTDDHGAAAEPDEGDTRQPSGSGTRQTHR